MPRLARHVSSEGFEALLLEVRDGANLALADFAVEQIRDDQQHEAKMADVRAVWHAAEIALGVLGQGRYVPKREALDDVRSLLESLRETSDDAGEES